MSKGPARVGDSSRVIADRRPTAEGKAAGNPERVVLAVPIAAGVAEVGAADKPWT